MWDRGVIEKTSGYNSPGQLIRLVRGPRGKPAELWVGGTKLLPKEAMVAEATQRYRKTGGTGKRPARKSSPG